jgi:ribonuclease P protein component
VEFTSSLKSNNDFRRVYRQGASAVRPCLVVYIRRSRQPGNRLGFTVTAKVGKAHTRNLVRRRLREIYRLHESSLRPGCDMVVVARTRAAQVSYKRLETEFLAACQELGAVL